MNLSGFGLVRWTDRRGPAVKLMEFLSRPKEQKVLIRNNHELPVAPGVRPTGEIARFGPFKRDPIDVEGAGRHLRDALRLMNEVGWN